MANILNWRSQVSFSTGDTVRVHQKVSEGEKTRTQIFEGVVMRIRGHQGLKSFTVRKIAAGGIGVEKIFPEEAPVVAKIEVVKKGKVNRAVLSYLRGRVGRRATQIKGKFLEGVKAKPEIEVAEEEKAAVAKKVAKIQKEEKKVKILKEKIKEKKKEKKKKKLERKERVFVR